jgi:hypothetical protein
MTYYSCVLVACTVCREAQHRHAYESSYVGGTFRYRAAAPDKLLRECIQERYDDEGEMRGVWDTVCFCTNGPYSSLATVVFWTASTVIIMVHVTQTWLLLVFTLMMDNLDISGLLLLPSAIVTGFMTSDDRCYCGARGTRVIADNAHSSNELYNISGSLLLFVTWHALSCYYPTVVTGVLTTVVRRY